MSEILPKQDCKFLDLPESARSTSILKLRRNSVNKVQIHYLQQLHLGYITQEELSFQAWVKLTGNNTQAGYIS